MQRREFLRGAIGAALAPRAFARNPRGVGIGNIAPPNTYKFNPGDFAQAGNFYNTSMANMMADLATINSAGTTGLIGYSFGREWSALETSSSSQSMSPQYDVAGTWEMINYQQALWTGSYTKLYFNANKYGQGLTVTQLTSTNLGNPAGFYVPAYIMECGGSVEIPTSPGSGSGATYSIAPCYVGSTSYGVYFDTVQGSVYETVTPAWTNAGVVHAWQNMVIYMTTIAECPTPSAYSSGTSYSAGQQALSGGVCYTYINATAGAGHALTNTSYWVANTPNYGGQTIDGCSAVLLVADNNEVSYNWISSENASTGPTVNPPQTVSGNPNTNMWFHTLYANCVFNICSALKKTPYIPCYSWGVQIGSTSDTAENMAANVNGNMPNGDRTIPSALSSITGLGFSTADTYGNLASTTNYYASSGQQGYLGVLNPITGGAPPTPGYASLKNVMLSDCQVQPLDLTAGNTGNYNAAAVENCMAGSVVMGAHYREWPLNDGGHTGGTNGGWSGTGGYIYAALIANQATYPCNATRPSGLP